MIRRLTNLQLLYAYIAGILLGGIIIFKVSLNPTIELRKDYKAKLQVLSTVSVAPQQIKKINDRLNKLNKQFSTFTTSTNSSRDRIMEEISSYCNSNNLSVYNYPETHLFDNKSFIVETNRIIIKGDFIHLLMLLNTIETKANFSRIVSIIFTTEQNRKTKVTELSLELIFQNIISNE